MWVKRFISTGFSLKFHKKKQQIRAMVKTYRIWPWSSITCGDPDRYRSGILSVIPTRWGPQSSSRSVGFFLWLNSMVYGRYNELVNGD